MGRASYYFSSLFLNWPRLLLALDTSISFSVSNSTTHWIIAFVFHSCVWVGLVGVQDGGGVVNLLLDLSLSYLSALFCRFRREI